MIAAQRDEHFEKRGDVFIMLPEMGIHASAGGGRRLADELKINLLGIAQIKRDQLIVAWPLGEFYSGVSPIITVEGIANGAQFWLKLLPEQ